MTASVGTTAGGPGETGRMVLLKMDNQQLNMPALYGPNLVHWVRRIRQNRVHN